MERRRKYKNTKYDEGKTPINYKNEVNRRCRKDRLNCEANDCKGVENELGKGKTESTYVKIKRYSDKARVKTNTLWKE